MAIYYSAKKNITQTQLVLKSYRKFHFNVLFKSLSIIYLSFCSSLFKLLIIGKITLLVKILGILAEKKICYGVQCHNKWIRLLNNTNATHLNSYIICKYTGLVTNSEQLDYSCVINYILSSFYLNNLLKISKHNMVNIPNSNSLYTVLRSPHTDKKSREQFIYKIKRRSITLNSAAISEMLQTYSNLLPSYLMLKWKYAENQSC